MNARYEFFIADRFVCLIDRDETGCRSVTNDIERVVAHDLGYLLTPGRRLVYRDSMGVWDEVLLSFSEGIARFEVFRTLKDDQHLKDMLDLLTPAFFGEPSDADLLRAGYKRPFRVLADGRVAAIMIINSSIVAVAVGIHAFGQQDAFYYRSHEQAEQALEQWRKGPEPAGWFRHPQSGRRRENGDPAREYYQP
ncbi:hypothetical protein [Paraburkholderia sp. MM5477-R1]|uniref:hypothetical protein n=1 Tax=Paraburkholderia sp. MM5477-R1 TaxID=2991062 RepID=UPI003D207E96